MYSASLKIRFEIVHIFCYFSENIFLKKEKCKQSKAVQQDEANIDNFYFEYILQNQNYLLVFTTFLK